MSAVDDHIAHLAGVVAALLDPSEVTSLLEASGAPSPHRAGHPAASFELLADLHQALRACTLDELDTVQFAARLCAVTPANLQEALAMATVVLRPPQKPPTCARANVADSRTHLRLPWLTAGLLLLRSFL